MSPRSSRLGKMAHQGETLYGEIQTQIKVEMHVMRQELEKEWAEKLSTHLKTIHETVGNEMKNQLMGRNGLYPSYHAPGDT